MFGCDTKLGKLYIVRDIDCEDEERVNSHSGFNTVMQTLERTLQLNRKRAGLHYLILTDEEEVQEEVT